MQGCIIWIHLSKKSDGGCKKSPDHQKQELNNKYASGCLLNCKQPDFLVFMKGKNFFEIFEFYAFGYERFLPSTYLRVY